MNAQFYFPGAKNMDLTMAVTMRVSEWEHLAAAMDNEMDSKGDYPIWKFIAFVRTGIRDAKQAFRWDGSESKELS